MNFHSADLPEYSVAATASVVAKKKKKQKRKGAKKASPAAKSVPPLCDGCGQEKESNFCEECGLVRYCDVECQKYDWGFHKEVCKVVRTVSRHRFQFPTAVEIETHFATLYSADLWKKSVFECFLKQLSIFIPAVRAAFAGFEEKLDQEGQWLAKLYVYVAQKAARVKELDKLQKLCCTAKTILKSAGASAMDRKLSMASNTASETNISSDDEILSSEAIQPDISFGRPAYITLTKGRGGVLTNVFANSH
jgi:hypothetical protein